MNDLNSTTHSAVIVENLKYGLTTMHAWIKSLECVLHISYKMNLKAPIIKNASKEAFLDINNRQKDIHEKLYKALGIKIDKIVQDKGTSNTGNVGCIFFRNYKKTSEITGVDENLIQRFYIILTALSSGHQLNSDYFDKFTRETAKLYVDKYNCIKCRSVYIKF